MPFSRQWNIDIPQDTDRVYEGASRLRELTQDTGERINAFAPIGMITEWPMDSNIPDGWMECDGSAISRSTYAALFALISTSYGAGDGSTTFNIPDLRGIFVRCWDHGCGIDREHLYNTAKGNIIAGNVTLSGITGLKQLPVVGDTITGSGIPRGTTVAGVTGTTGTMTITMSAAALTTATGVVFALNIKSRGRIVKGSNTITVYSRDDLNYKLTVGSLISGYGIPAGSTISSVVYDASDNVTDIVISNNVTYTDTASALLDVYFVVESNIVASINGTTTVTITTGLSKRPRIGSRVTGADIPMNTFITALTGAGIPTAITISAAATATGSTTLTIDGDIIGTTQDDDNESHAHGVWPYVFLKETAAMDNRVTDYRTSTEGGSEMRPENMAMMYIIRTDTL